MFVMVQPSETGEVGYRGGNLFGVQRAVKPAVEVNLPVRKN